MLESKERTNPRSPSWLVLRPVLRKSNSHSPLLLRSNLNLLGHSVAEGATPPGVLMCGRPAPRPYTLGRAQSKARPPLAFMLSLESILSHTLFCFLWDFSSPHKEMEPHF